MSRFGTVAQQYFNASGKPLAGGKLTFFEPGTTTPKTVYSDSAESTSIAQPVTLDASGYQPDVFFSGQAKVVLTDSDDVQIDVADPVGIEPAEQFPLWSSSISYSAGALVQGSDDALYKSLGNSNLNNNPVSTSGFWQRYDGIQLYSASATYNADDIVISSGALYRCATDSTSAVTPAASASEWDLLGIPPAGGTITGDITFDGAIANSSYTITDGPSVTIDPANGTQQTWVLGDDRTPTISLGDDEWVLLRVADGTAYTLTLNSTTIVNAATIALPTTGYALILIWKIGSTQYAAGLGDVA